MSFTCRRCGQEHPGPPMAYASTAPGRWYTLTDEEREHSRMDGELCVIGGTDFYLRANVEIPVADSDDPLVLSTWVALDATSLRTLLARWDAPERTTDPAYPATLANDLPGYPETLGLDVEVHTGAPGHRARAVPSVGDHPLSVDHWEGITMDRVRELAELLAHPDGSP